MSCCGGKCGCGADCKCGNGCGGSGMYPDMDKAAVTTSPTLIMGVAPFSKPSFEVAAAEAENRGSKCGANLTCDPCELYLDMHEAMTTSETFIIGALLLQAAVRVRRRRSREQRLRGMYPDMDKAVTTSQTIIMGGAPFSKSSFEVAAAGAENGGCKCGANCTCDRPVHLQVKI